MNCNSFNSKVNLPKFCLKLGYSDYQFKKIPTFGWFAYNKDKTFIGNIFDLVSQKDKEYLYALISKDKPEYLDFDLAYSDMLEAKIKYNLLEIQLWTAAYAYAKKELETYKFQHNGKRLLLKDVLLENGFGGVIANGMGVVTNAVIEKFNMLPWPKSGIVGKILVPSFCTPYHICSLEYCSWETPTTMYPLFLNDEKGWYGNLGHKHVVSDVKELWTTPGNTWDYKADYWYPDSIISISEQISPGDAIKIWTTAENTAFEKSPLTQIIDAGKLDELKLHIGNLSLKQLQEAEKQTGEKLIPYWKKAREHQVQIGSKIFTKRDNRYWVYKKGKLEEVTNFAVDVHKIYKKGFRFYRKGDILFGDEAVPFEMEERYFTTNYMFHRGIKEKFLNSGLGVPIIHPDFFGKALLIVDSFNSGVQVEISDLDKD